MAISTHGSARHRWGRVSADTNHGRELPVSRIVVAVTPAKTRTMRGRIKRIAVLVVAGMGAAKATLEATPGMCQGPVARKAKPGVRTAEDGTITTIMSVATEDGTGIAIRMGEEAVRQTTGATAITTIMVEQGGTAAMITVGTRRTIGVMAMEEQEGGITIMEMKIISRRLQIAGGDVVVVQVR